jgi:hypothetical protein
MIEAEYLDIVGSEIPVRKIYSFGGESYQFFFKKNEQYDFFTIELYDATGETFLFSNKIVYGQPVIDSLLAPFQDKIIPLNLAVLQTGEGVKEITADTLGNEIKLYTNIITTG